MARPSDANGEFVAHIVSQMQQNVSFLVEHNYITDDDAADIMSRLPASDSQSTNSMSIRSPSSTVAFVPPARRAAPPAASRVQKARVLWAYNEDGSEPDDLSFSVGETVEITDESNPDWWMGRCRGKQGLFPSNHVEKMSAAAAAPPLPVASTTSYPSEKGRSAPGSGRFVPPAPLKGTAPRMAPPPPPVPQQQAQPQQKSSMSGLKGTMAKSAAGGVGFGAGAAIGGGLVRAIF